MIDSYPILFQIPIWTDPLAQVIEADIGRIAWNTFLAIVPLTLSFFLFELPRSKFLRWGTYVLLGVSFTIGITEYNNGDLLEALKKIIFSLWGVRSIFIGISIGLIILLMGIDFRSRSPQDRSRSVFWWIGLFFFIAILPNAPYILTDIIHFYDAVRDINSAWAITFVIVPIYVLFIGVGWFAYVFSLINVGRYLDKYPRGSHYINTIELILHLLCAIGIYIGRFIRFNSWSLITDPKHFLRVLPRELIGKFPLVVILLTFLIITVLYTISKPPIKNSALCVER
jgi:uncharacterized membrane protein